MARLELENALEMTGLRDEAQRKQINVLLDRIAMSDQEDTEAQAEEALRNGDHQKARYYLNVALSRLEEGSSEFDRIKSKLDFIPEGIEEAEIEDELETILRADVGVSFLDRQRALEFWKSGFPPYREEYYFNKALTSNVVQAQAEQVSKNPDDADGHFNFGVTLAQLGLIKKALEQIRFFVLLRPEDRDGHYFLANLLADQGYDEEAIREFEKTITLDPGFAEAYFYLAEHYRQLKDFERAERLYQHIIEREKGSELAEESQAKLEAIREGIQRPKN
jgi:tetratricopeptide (TPR) repeat protein